MRQLLADCREMLTEQVQYRELLYEMTRRDLVLRYKQTIMGFGWAVFMPLVNTAVFSVIFTRVAPIETPVPYPLFAYCGLLAWNFSASTMRALWHPSRATPSGRRFLAGDLPSSPAMLWRPWIWRSGAPSPSR
jgi:hypothetical protein